MTIALNLKTFDTWPPVSGTLSDVNGVINLTTAVSVKFIMKGNRTGTVVTGACVITDAANGRVQYTWSHGPPADTAIADTYQVEFEINWGSNEIQTVPNAATANVMIQIDADLEGS